MHGGASRIAAGRFLSSIQWNRLAMAGNGPTDNEDAFFAALIIIVKTAIEAGVDRTVVAAQLQEVAAAARVDKCFGNADALDVVANC
jgi:hypothetical protein